MEPSWDYGTPDAARAFVAGLHDDDSVALISHTDHDGLGAAYVMTKVVPKYKVLKFCDYAQLNLDLADELRSLGINKVIFSDLFLRHREFVSALEEFAEVLILDHHPSEVDWNSHRTTFVKIENYYCAAYMCYYIFSDVVDLEVFDWFVASSCVADYCIEKNAAWMESVFAKYGDAFVPDLDRLKDTKIGRFQEIVNYALVCFKPEYERVYHQVGVTFGDLGDLPSYADKIRGEIDLKLQEFAAQKQSFPGGYYWEYTARYGVTAMVANAVSRQESDKKYVLVRLREDSDYVNISMRRQDKQEDLGQFIQTLLAGIEDADGGGHVPAAGGRLPKARLNEFKRRLGL